jgi:hypothetical protein
MAYQYYGENPEAPAETPAATTDPYPAGWSPKNKAELVAYAASKGWSEDFARFDDATVNNWIANYWDPSAGAFKSDKTTPEGQPIEGRFEKPSDTPAGWGAWGQYAIRNDDPRMQQGSSGGGGASGGAYGGAQTGYGGAPAFTPPPDFVAPTWQEAMADPGYQFALQEGTGALQRSQAAKGVLRTGGSLKDLIGYGQGLATQQYGAVYDRAADVYAKKYQASKDVFAPLYGSWETSGGWDLSKYLNRENNIYGLINSPEPTAPSYTG